jgi:5'-3' exonuclease
MGLPGYFSFLVKNHPTIIKKLLIKCNHLFLDSNSIIYDAVHSGEITSSAIISKVISKIEEYILLISPDTTIYIGFDGVCPVAKLEQQRDRRYKSWYTSEIMKEIGTELGLKEKWDTTNITPGTVFMKELGEKISRHFNNPAAYNVKNLIVSTSDEFQEAEHKIFKYIRENPSLDKTIVYGLDGDLVMLGINHLTVCPNLYLFRETPHFIQSLDSSLEPNQLYLLDIPELAKTILLNMNNGEKDEKNRIHDYIFLCFFLGNDFMKKFPALNIRTGGVEKLLNAYKATLGGTRDIMTDGKTIYWKNVRKVVAFLAEREEQYIQDEMKLRTRNEKRNYPMKTPEQIYTKFDAIPNYEREMEKFINPFKPGWKSRYYRALFQFEDDEEKKKQVCTNYFESLEWTMKYYNEGCPDWRWCYKYNYPPLLSDILEQMPYFETSFIKKNPVNPVSQIVQLCYVLPRPSLSLLPEKLYEKLLAEHEDWYGTDYDFAWSFCRYFWESHTLLPEIDVNALEEIIENM